MNKIKIDRAAKGFVCLFAALFLLTACSSLLSSFQQADPQSATLTAMVTPSVPVPTLDLHGNEVLSYEACEPYSVVSISIMEDRPIGPIFAWADNADLFAYVAPENRYWAWFSGDAVVLDFSNDPLSPKEMTTTGYHVFGDFAFSPDLQHLAFVAFRQSEKLYTVMIASLDSELKTVRDLFSGSIAATDEFSSDKSVIEWQDDANVRVSSSCGIDCEQIYLANINTGKIVLEEETRKYGHEGRTFPMNTHDYDVRDYPVMAQPNWSPDNRIIFYTDTQNKSWILYDQEKKQFELTIEGNRVLQSLWSYDSEFIALRTEDKIHIFKVNCSE